MKDSQPRYRLREDDKDRQVNSLGLKEALEYKCLENAVLD